jgi:hypothetical protein
MEIDRFELNNLLSMKYTKKIINAAINKNNGAGAIDDIVVEIAEEALQLASAKRSERDINIAPSVNLSDDVRDSQGRRRYKLACVNDEPVMAPDPDGFWTPVNG